MQREGLHFYDETEERNQMDRREFSKAPGRSVFIIGHVPFDLWDPSHIDTRSIHCSGCFDDGV